MKTQELGLHCGEEVRRAVFAVVDDADVEPFAAAPASLLGAVELAQLAGFGFAKKRQGFLLGRLAAKSALGTLLAEPDLPSIEIGAGMFGQPLVRHPRALGTDVTVSHSHGMAVALAYPADWPMGIDLETVADDAVAAVRAALEASAEERAWLSTVALEEAVACGVLWSAREALGKALKTGLNCPLGILSLCAIAPVVPVEGDVAWCGGYANFPQSKWIAWPIGGRVLTLALPAKIEPERMLRL